MNKCGMPYSRSCFYKTDKRRINNAECKDEEFVKCKRKKERSLKNKQADAFVSFKYKQMFFCILLIKYLHNMHNTPLLKIPLW